MFKQNYHSFQWTRKTAACLGAIALSSSIMVVSGCTQPETTAPNNVTSEAVVEETEQLIGQTVTIRSEIEEKLGNEGYVVESNEFFGGEEILIIDATGTPMSLSEAEDVPIQVTGEVAQFVIADIEREYGIGLDPNLYAEYEQQPAIIAQSIALAPDPEELAENPEAYYNRVVAVEAEVAEVYSPSAYTVGEEGWFSDGELLVVGVTPNSELMTENEPEDRYVTVTGVLRPYITSEFERDYDLTWDLDLQQEIEAEFQEKPVLVASDVYPSAKEEY
ncbi:hypothetical protein [Crocosphaera chwakensis]|uniref:Uncharacterized protein n=1 Tax=Crocosphaera chwakensis CCY0110 TaxID=391612 RepID=A3IVP0_9CHRO|nr:hypothetical protein [Crocosphaera chwakensis]EAZ89430.1 hypothetical protein CY0110_27019 [Crocosphaera chwakensis CCY0110]